MENEANTEDKSIIDEIKQKIRLVNAIAVFIIFTLLAVILRYLFKPVSEMLDFLPDVSVTVVIVIVLALSVMGFYMSWVVSRRIIKSIEKYRNSLDRILTITRNLREEKYGDIILEKLLDYSLSMTGSDAGSVFLIEGDNLVFKAIAGDEKELIGTAIPKGRGVAGLVAENGRPLRIADIKEDGRFADEADAVTGYEARSVLCVPLMMHKKVIGAIELVNRKEGFYSDRDTEMITYLADQTAISLVQARFYEDQKNYEIHITDILLEVIDIQVPEKAGHSKRVARYSNIIAKAINMSEESQQRLYFAGLLHDVGFLKIKTDDNYKREYFVTHPVVGYEMINPINFYEDIAHFILYHHERYDGSGYPKGLKGEEIPLGARIIAIAEAFDSMVSEESYKVPLDFKSAVEELQRNAGSQFDFWLVDVFVNNVTPELLQ